MAPKTISRKTRQQVYDKYGGRCAYCGCELSLKEMQIDHIQPVYRGWPDESLARFGGTRGSNELDNLNPSCRQCNFYKGSYDIEYLRRNIKTIMERVRKPFIYRLAEKYGMVAERMWGGKFYFERIDSDEKDNVQ